MIFASAEDFFKKAEACHMLTRQEELDCAKQMVNGDILARERLIQGYLPVVARYIKRIRPDIQTFGLVLYCVHALEQAVDSFDFLQNSEPFSHRLNWWLRQATTKYAVR